MLFGFGLVANIFVYQAFFTGIYNYRTTELLNMKRVPLPVKLGLSLSVSAAMCFTLYNDSLYDERLYALALKYRPQFDEHYAESLKQDQTEVLFAGN
jgi:hypothetical protein